MQINLRHSSSLPCPTFDRTVGTSWSRLSGVSQSPDEALAISKINFENNTVGVATSLLPLYRTVL